MDAHTRKTSLTLTSPHSLFRSHAEHGTREAWPKGARWLMETKEGKLEGRDDWQNLAWKVARRLKKLPYRSLFLLSPSCSPWPAPLPNWETKGDKSKFDHRKQDRLVQTIGPRRLNRLEEIQAELPFLFLVTLRSLLAGWSENCFQKDSYTNDKQIQDMT